MAPPQIETIPCVPSGPRTGPSPRHRHRQLRRPSSLKRRSSASRSRPRPSPRGHAAGVLPTPRGDRGRLHPSITSRFDFVRHLGAGAFGTVDLVRDRASGQQRVCKTVSTIGMKKRVLEQMRREIQVLSSLEHRNIVKIFHYCEDPKRFQIMLILEHLPGGGCERLCSQNRLERGSEITAGRLIRQLTAAVAYCHKQDIVHRDLKPEHMMLTSNDIGGSPEIKVIDFGLAGASWSSSRSKRLDRTGTPAYMAPEVVNQEASSAAMADVWSIGICACEMLTGFSPFQGEDSKHCFTKIQAYSCFSEIEAVAEMHAGREWRRLSGDAKDFLRSLLRLDPEDRPSAAEALLHPWLIKVKVGVDERAEAVRALAMFARADPNLRACHVITAACASPAELQAALAPLAKLPGMDLSRTGRVARRELLSVLGTEIGCGSDKIDMNELLSSCGIVDHCGCIPVVDLMAASLCGRSQPMGRVVEDAFCSLDADGDGVVQVQDLASVIDSRRFPVLDALQHKDCFSLEEWQAAIRRACGCSPGKVSKLRLCVAGSRALTRPCT